MALGSLGDTIVALTRDQLLWRDPRTRGWTLGPNLSALLGGLVAFVAGRPGLLGGRRPGRRLRAAGHAARASAPGRATCPAPRNDLAVDADYLWVAHRRRTGAVPARRRPAVTRRAAGVGPGASSIGCAASPPRSGPRATGLGDDCAVLAAADAALVASTDVSVEGVHFRRDWLSLEEIGWRATAAALSDLAADGAEAAGVLVALTVPADGERRGRRRRS